MTFAELGLRPELVRAVDHAGYTRPTPIQERTIPVVLNRRDLIGCAQTGTGKTAAFLLPLLERLADRKTRHPRALVITPTRELAAQIGDMAQRYGKYLHLGSTVIFGGTGMVPQTRRLAAGLDLLIATPGRLLDHVGRRQVNLGNIEMVVLDEADRMLDMGFLPDVRRILAALPKSRQNLFFSATMPHEIEDLIRRTTTEPELIEVAPRAKPISAIRQVVHPVAMTRKRDLLKTLLQHPDIGQTLVFTRTKARANQLVKHLENTGRKVAAIHANKSQAARTRALAGFRNGEIDTLVATDIAARGLDVDDISHVINFDLPHVAEDYVHRIGRTARAGRTGNAITFAAPEERNQLAAIERLIGTLIHRELIPGFGSDMNEIRSPRRPKQARRPSRPGRPRGQTAKRPRERGPAAGFRRKTYRTA